MRSSIFIAVLAAASLAACTTPGSEYAKSHPALPPLHRQILVTGKIPGGTAVEGMTKEQVRLALGNPARTERLDGQEVWAYVRLTFLNTGDDDIPVAAYGSGANDQRNFTETADLGPRTAVHEVTHIFFRGDRATRAQITRERP